MSMGTTGRKKDYKSVPTTSEEDVSEELWDDGTGIDTNRRRLTLDHDNDEDDNTGTETDDDMYEPYKNKDDAIKELLSLCASQNVKVPDDLAAVLLTGSSKKSKKEQDLSDSFIKSRIHEREDEILHKMQDDKLFIEIYENYKRLKVTPPKLNLAIKDGGYTVINEVETKLTNNSNLNENEEEEGGFTTSLVGSVVKSVQRAQQKIATVGTESPVAKLLSPIRRFIRKGRCTKDLTTVEKHCLRDVNLLFETGKFYLILGAPGSGKSTLLKYIANTLRDDKTHLVNGFMNLNGISPNTKLANDNGKQKKKVIWSNLTAYIDQIDRLHKYLTVYETCDFAWQCTSGGTHEMPYYDMNDEQVRKQVKEFDDNQYLVNMVLRAMGLSRVKDTFVGDNTSVRGVSGGEKKRVTVSEMFCTAKPILCLDEISTGLDAATTYDICKIMSSSSKLTNTVRIVSLLQPAPETVSQFDELILLDKGYVIYAGPVGGVVEYFESLGYEKPDRMDAADWLQQLPTRDGEQYLSQQYDDVEGSVGVKGTKHLSTFEFATKFQESDLFKEMSRKIEESISEADTLKDEINKMFSNKELTKRYSNTIWRSLRLLISRELLLWWRDKYQIKARLVQDFIMGIVAGTLFYQQWYNPQSVMGILFQSMFFVSVGAMIKIPAQFDIRGIVYKHQDGNFFPTWCFVLGRSLALVPSALTDSLVYGTIVYWFVGLAHDDGASIANYFIFLLIILLASICCGLQFSIFSSIMKDKVTAQAAMAITIVLFVLFSGFTVQPDVIPAYWIWLYWINMYSWNLRALVVNEYQSGKYDYPISTAADSPTAGEAVLEQFGFTTVNGEAYTFEWVWYSVAVTIGIAILSIIVASYFLDKLRFDTGKSLAVEGSSSEGDDYGRNNIEVEEIALPFQRVNLTFKDIRYTVISSITNEELELLKGVDGCVESGKMTALMGSSGAGKTTLMDVLSLRKTSGTISGDVRLNGHIQEENSFRRCTGYVEQFDVQSPQLTVRETVEFSARLRLNEDDPAVSDESIMKFVEQTLDMLELIYIQDLQVGDDIGGGLSFEQNKRLSIAVEVAANPSILFLDEPTSGLDARAASIVVRGLKRIALTGRAVCATIHQPSVSIFNSFDSLLLLKRGGEVVFFGDLGENSTNLIKYFERYPSTPKILDGENPSTWMLTTIGAGSSSNTEKPFDYAGSYFDSKLRQEALAQIDNFNSQSNDENKVSFKNKYATCPKTQRWAVMKRALRIYWRSPSYNMVRLVVSLMVALIFGSVYVTSRVPENEGDMNSRVTSIFVTMLFLCVNAFNTVLAVFERERNMFYRHKAAQMYDQRATVMAFTFAEIPFICLAGLIFTIGWYFLVGFNIHAGKFFFYLLFMVLALGTFTFLGQMMVSLLRDAETAQGAGGLITGMTSLFSGLLIRPQNINGFWTFAYWTFPGHYILEGLVASQFKNDDTPIVPSIGSDYCTYVLQANSNTCTDPNDCTTCVGTAEEWIQVSFGGQFRYSNIPWNILYLVGIITVSKIVGYVALKKLNYLAK